MYLPTAREQINKTENEIRKQVKQKEFLLSGLDGSWMRKEHHPLESIAAGRTCCAATVAPRPPTFRSQPAASVATPPNARQIIAGVPRLRDETLPGLVG